MTEEMIPYGRQTIEPEDIEAVAGAMRSGWLTTGPQVEAFEEDVASYTGAQHGVAVSSGTAALHAAVRAAGIGPGDEVIVPALTFAATANAVLFEKGRPVLADIDLDHLVLDPDAVQARITNRTRAILPVDFAGHPADYSVIREIAEDHDLTVIADACHALGAAYGGQPVGTLADHTVLSFHPVKHITTGEGGMVLTDDRDAAETMRRFRHHCMDRSHHDRAEHGAWEYRINGLGQNYRLSDLHCALGRSQLAKLPGWLARRREIAERYDDAFDHLDGIEPQALAPNVEHAYHLYVIRLTDGLQRHRAKVFDQLRAAGIGVNVHYIPIHHHPYHQQVLDLDASLLPNTEAAYAGLLSLPMWPGLSTEQVGTVIDAVTNVVGGLASKKNQV